MSFPLPPVLFFFSILARLLLWASFPVHGTRQWPMGDFFGLDFPALSRLVLRAGLNPLFCLGSLEAPRPSAKSLVARRREKVLFFVWGCFFFVLGWVWFWGRVRLRGGERI